MLLFSVGIHQTAVCVRAAGVLSFLFRHMFSQRHIGCAFTHMLLSCSGRLHFLKCLEAIGGGRCRYAADPEHFHTEEALFLKNWCWISAELSVKKMLKEDIKTTNGKDKDEQLESLNRLSETLKTLHEVSGIWGASATYNNLSNVDPITCDTLARH